MADMPEITEALTVESRKDQPGSIVIKWVAVAEVMADDGERYLMTLKSEDAAQWDAIGMHRWAIVLAEKCIESE